MVDRGKRRRLDSDGASAEGANSPQERAYPSDPLSAATLEDKMKWKGFCEIESEPVGPLIISARSINVHVAQGIGQRQTDG